MEKHILSKSTFIKGYHCLKSLYLHKKRPFLRDRLTAEQRAKFKRGHKVGDMAQHLFPGGIDVSPKSPSQYQKSAVRTGELIEQGQEIIYEATFQFNKVLVMLDILVKTEDGWDAYEVKSSKSLSETYYTDAALQYYVIENSGLKINKFYLVYVDENYRLNEELNIQEYFIKKDVTQDLIPKQEFIGSKIEEEMIMLQEKHSPKIAVGDHCFAPYKCDFVGFCWKKIADKTYLPISLENIETLSIPKESIPISFIFSEQAIPECKNEIAYFQKCIAYKIGDGEVVISGKSCEEKKTFIHSFFKELKEGEKYITYDLKKTIQWLGEIAIQFPEFANKIEEFKNNSHGILETLIEADHFEMKDSSKYSLAFLAKDILKDSSLSKSTIYSDLLATDLYQNMKEDFWGDESPDIESLKEYLNAQTKITKALMQL